MPTTASRGRRALRLAGVATALAALACLAAPATASAATLPVTWSTSGYLVHPLSPQRSPAGANDWTCRSRQHPVPVVLVHGTGANQSNNWNAIAPYLANHGYCVYTFTHGIKLRYFGGLAPVADSAAELRTFVEQVVLPRTGATQVDLVGHSLGGMMPRYYIKFLGGYTKVRHLVGIAPSNHGSTLDGLSGIGTFLGITALLGRGTPSLADQAQGSAFMKKMDTCPFGLPAADICAGDPVKYTVIQTTQDRIVTPYTHSLDPRTAGPKVGVKTSALDVG